MGSSMIDGISRVENKVDMLVDYRRSRISLSKFFLRDFAPATAHMNATRISHTRITSTSIDATMTYAPISAFEHIAPSYKNDV